jgi:hypothetical protein
MHLLKLYHDELAAKAEVVPGLETQHSIIYVWKGSANINGALIEKDTAIYVGDFAGIKAQSKGASLWRWEIVPETDPVHLIKGKGINSLLKMSRRVKMFEMVPTSKWLFRLDCIMEFEGTTGLHSHPGSGIRCMLNGVLHAVSEKGECSDNTRPGDVWYEEGAYPLVSTADKGIKTTFLRGMVLPPEYLNYPDTAMWIEGNAAKISGWKSYAQKIVTLR